MGATCFGDQRGFALLITITLLAFVMLLVVSLAALTRVETSVAANNQQLAQARQNALFALTIAIGQLQKHAGPDARITARAEITSTATVTHPNLTGVWDAAGSGTAANVWLVSGSETATSAAAVLESMPDPADDTLTNDTLFLVGNQSVAVTPSAPTAAEKARRVKVIKQNIAAPAGSVPGLGPGDTPWIGRYAWWVGDQGVKASLALPDRADEVTYAPWNTPTQRRRIRQQIASMPNYFRAGTAVTAYAKEGFDPLTATTLKNITSQEQLSFLTPTAGAMTSFVRTYCHDFTHVAHAVLANTLPPADAQRGLMHDLSLKPDGLGAAFVAYADCANYMEAPGTTFSGADSAHPGIEGVDSPRRRYRIVPPMATASASGLPDLVFGVAPVLTDFMLQFKFERATADVLTVKARLYVALWNPYTAALAPTATEGLAVEITGLPQVTVTDSVTAASAVVDLQASLPSLLKGTAGELRARLPFGNAQSTRGTQADRSSWLPGRVYGWATETGTTPTENLQFYEKNINAQGWTYPTVPLSGGTANALGVSSGSVTGLTIRVRSAAGVLATYALPSFQALNIAATTETWKFAFASRLKQPLFGDSERTWLKTHDPRHFNMPATGFGGFDPLQDITPLDPSVYSGSTAPSTAYPEYLLYRIQGSLSGTTPGLSLGSYNDVPLFELPRMPLLSVGELQHVQVKDTRPFAIGNSWGGTANAIFDRYFFSGLPATVSAAAGVPDLSAGQPLPNWNLRVADGSDINTVRSAMEHSSRHLLQAGAFNINSTRVVAWRAMLSGVRFAQAFNPAEIENSSGQSFGTQKTDTALGRELFDADASLGVGTAAPAFLRFSQSAQETYFWKPVTGVTNKRLFSTHAFRLGVRASGTQTTATSAVDSSITAHLLTTDKLEELATEIVRLIKVRGATSGPFRNLQEFLGPESGAGTPSLLEAAIANSGINADEVQPLDTVALLPGGGYGAGFSSLTLTQADILGALAPYLRARSDTFMIRTYGEAVNPITNEEAGRAWLEATVQRFPEVVISGDNIEQPAGVLGRRFKIISFRWLSPSDI